MDAPPQTSGALLERVGADVVQLLKRFENVIGFAPMNPQDDRTTTAVMAYQMEVETAALVRAAEDILALTRTLKEAWLFGKLATVGTSPAEERAAESARRVEGGLKMLQGE